MTDINESTEQKEERKFAKIAELLVSGKVAVDPEIFALVEYFRNLKTTEDTIAHRIAGWITHHPIYEEYLSHIQGIGPIFSANLIAMLTPITRFPKPSMLVAYAGIAGQHYEQECEEGHKFLTTSPKTACPVNLNETTAEEKEVCGARIHVSQFVQSPMKRKKGYHVFLNARMKTLLFKIANSFEKQNSEKSQYRLLYDVKKAEYNSREGMTKGHARMMAMRYVEKRFLQNLHIVWMTALGNDVTPYEAILPNHTIDPIVTDDGYHLPGKGSMKLSPETENWTIRQLTDSYYDIQKMRLKSFNNVIAWVKNNPSKVENISLKD